jgi:hypothetical protein
MSTQPGPVAVLPSGAMVSSRKSLSGSWVTLDQIECCAEFGEACGESLAGLVDGRGVALAGGEGNVETEVLEEGGLSLLDEAGEVLFLFGEHRGW